MCLFSQAWFWPSLWENPPWVAKHPLWPQVLNELFAAKPTTDDPRTLIAFVKSAFHKASAIIKERVRTQGCTSVEQRLWWAFCALRAHRVADEAGLAWCATACPELRDILSNRGFAPEPATEPYPLTRDLLNREPWTSMNRNEHNPHHHHEQYQHHVH